MMVAVIDYGIGNVQSVVNACERHGSDTRRVVDGSSLSALRPDRIILPGVGAIGAALKRLRDRDLEPVLAEHVFERRIAFLGICVGMQMLAETCEEFGSHKGLGWIPGVVRRLQPDGDLQVPHAGWNTVRVRDGGDPVLSVVDGANCYFVHSFAMICELEHVAATTFYGGEFTSAVRRDNILGVQFHPEKSSAVGADLIGRFVRGV